MKKPVPAHRSDSCLRRRAEQQLPVQSPAAPTPLTEADSLAMVHELKVHQIELEMQNEELRRAQADLMVMEARYRDLYEFAPVGYLTLDANDRILETNLCGAALLGVGRRDLINRYFPACLSDDSLLAYQDFARLVRHSGSKQMCELTTLQAGGNVRHLQADAVATDEIPGVGSQIRIAIMDITERKHFEHAASERAYQIRSNFENVFDEGPLGIAFVDLNKQFLSVNGRLIAMLGYTKAELLSMNVRDLVHPLDLPRVLDDARLQVAGEAASLSRETRYTRKDGGVFWARTLVTIMRDSRQQPMHFLKIVEDVTDHKMAEQGRLAAIVQERTRIAQDIHDTLAQGFTGILIQLQAAAYAPEQDLARVHIAAASDLARESLQEARRSVRALRPIALEGGDLPSALAHLVEHISVPNSMKVQLAVHGTPVALPEEMEDHLYRIGQEALTNAIKHSQAAEIMLELWFEASQVRLIIRDNGNGFDAKSGFQGSGFGLVGMSERAEQIGGLMSLIASPGKGTTITVTVSAPAGKKRKRLS